MFMWMCIVSEMVWCTSFFVCDMGFWGDSGKNLREGFEGGTHRKGTHRKIIYFMCGFGH